MTDILKDRHGPEGYVKAPFLRLSGKNLIAALMGVALFAAFAHAAGPEGAGNRTAARELPGHFGIMLPLSGNLKALGQKVLDGIVMGAGLYGPGGKKGPVFHIADTESDPSLVQAKVEELREQGVTAIIGPIKGDEAREAARAARRLGVTLITITPARDIAGGMVFRLNLREEEETEAIAAYAIKELGMKRLAILAPDTAQGKLYRNLFWDAVIRNGGEIAGAEIVGAPDPASMKGPIERLTGIYDLGRDEQKKYFEEEMLAQADLERSLLSSLGHRPRSRVSPAIRTGDFSKYKPAPRVDFDGVFIPVASLEAAQYAPMFPYFDVGEITLLGIRTWNYTTLLKVGREYVEGARFPVEWSAGTEEGRKFLKEFNDNYNRDPGALEAYGFDAASLLTAAWRKGEADTNRAVATFLASLSNEPALTGPLTTTKDGDIAGTAKIMAVRRRNLVPAAQEQR